MPENRDQENQQEFFGEFSKQAERTERLPALAKSQKPFLVSITSEQILLTGILLILGFCAVFLLGVMRGKVLARAALPSPQAARAFQPPPVPVKAAVPPPPTALPKPAVPEKTIGDASKPYSIQLVTHKRREYAESELQSLRQKGLYVFMTHIGDYFQVCAGQYANKDSAKKDLVFFRAKYKDCFLIRRR